MAEDKKKPVAPIGTNLKEEIIFLLAGLFILALIVNQITNYIYSIGWGNFSNVWNYLYHSYFYPWWSVWKVIAVALSAGLVVWILYSYRQLNLLAETEKKNYGSSEDSLLDEFMEEVSSKKKLEDKWDRVLAHSYSDHASDWRLAIMEADIMLDEALRAKGFVGESVGEMLKLVKEGDMQNIETAWEAHKVRNRIAHSGGDFELNERETRRVITLFEAVLKELGAI
ncbi:MAG: hypothetical protein A3A26_02050 [Candidatus Zambryskibacteria bacterium RIFCSPLOWO2_01_FULL_47_14]|uniref:DUF4145 domain-containing protein n=1 Tax=Candidatus Zambryskibacteria bacterium RIFCSPLOWO2_01_FULL_47_14 TaxID=1802763 RepID=A0A1G2U796_9BACT|nr:MAG: hypothetical protein A3A26_02050 [Candidatus Zambryskibacteria bacterium RIFCSPLOWO2_01_FULL_47_14]